MKHLILIISILFSIQNSQAQQKEVFIIGTMHQVSKTFKNSYRPLLKKGIEYNPDAIFVERLRPKDTFEISMIFDKFYHFSDSLEKVYPQDEGRFQKLLQTDLKLMSKEDFNFMMYSFIIKKDYGNYRYYLYLKKYGLKGSPKSLRNENDDLSHRLAIAKNMTQLYAMDDQHKRPEYFKAWMDCSKKGKENGNQKVLKRLGIKDFFRAMIPAITGRLGFYTNSKKTIEYYHTSNSFRYTKTECQSCEDGKYYWDLRNAKMAQNIVEQIDEHQFNKNLVVVGAGHVIGIKEAIEKNYPHIKVRIMSDKKSKSEPKNQVAQQ